MLLINGIGASLEALEPFVTALDGAVEVIRFDPPGVGGSPLPPGPYRFTGLCRLIAGMLTELGHDQADVLGISWGGAVAQHFAAFQRDRCRRLVLVATAAGPPMMLARPAVLARLMTPRRYLDRAYLERVAGNLYGGSARTDWAAASTALHSEQRNGPSRGYFYQLGAVAGWTGVPFLPWLRQPALILAWPGTCTAARPGPTGPRPARPCIANSGTARRAGTSTSSAPWRAGPASRSCPGCASRR